jgi:predicted MFS family arabinose efflux permease
VSQSYLRSIYMRLAGVVMLVVILALAANAYLSHREFERALAPEMAKKVASGGASARGLVLKAMEHRIAFRDLYGVEQTFDELKGTIPEIAYVAVTDPQGSVLYERFKAPAGAREYFVKPAVLATMSAPDAAAPAIRVGDQYVVSLPIVAPHQAVGMLHIGVSVDFVDRIILDMLFDVLVVLVVALFFTLELLNFMAGSKLEASLRALGESIERGANGDFTPLRHRGTAAPFGAVFKLLEEVRGRVNTGYAMLARDIEAGRRVPAHERPPGLAAAHNCLQSLAQRYAFGNGDATARNDDSQLAKIRAPLFIFILAEELTRPFLPGYIKSLLVPVPWLPAEVVVGLPIALFMLIVALGQPFLGAWSQRVGNRHAMLVGAAIAAFGFAASAFAASVLDLLLWRSLCALGYGLVFVSAQGHVLEHANAANRARSFALFIGAIMVATVCGPSIGGILADNIGERLTLVVAALLALGSIGAIRLLPRHDAESAGAQSAARPPRLAEIVSLLVNRRFMTVTGLAAIPAKVLLTGVCFYLVPLYVLSLGSTQSVVGRILMVYGVVMVVISPLAASFATTRERMEWLVGGGLLLSGIGALLLMAGPHVGWIFAAVTLIGLGQSLSIAAQSALVREHCDAEVAAMGEPAVYGVYRLLERLGNALGPILAALLLTFFGYRTGFVATGAAVALCGLAFIIATRRTQGGPALAPV